MITIAEIGLNVLYGIGYVCMAIGALYFLTLFLLVVGLPLWWVWAEYFSEGEPMEVAGADWRDDDEVETEQAAEGVCKGPVLS